MSSDRIISVERVIPAPPERIFEVVADPRRHAEIDGSGTVREADVDGPTRLGPGDRFGMAMKMGMKYRMINTVTEFTEGRLIAWAPKIEVRGKVNESIGGRVWRYELEAVEGGTLVRETWDATKEKGWLFHRLMRTPSKVRASMTKTLEQLERVVTSG